MITLGRWAFPPVPPLHLSSLFDATAAPFRSGGRNQHASRRNGHQQHNQNDNDVQAVRVCVEARQKVTFYDDVLTSLQELSFHYRLGAITNGNASLQAIGVAHLFDVELAASMQRPAKPAPDMFLEACDVLGVPPASVLHVGDHPVNDVAAAKEAGCKTRTYRRAPLLLLLDFYCQ